MMDRLNEAEAALAGARQSQRRLAERTRWSFGRHLGGAAILTTIVASLALPTPFQIGVTALMLLAVAWVAQRDRTRDGMFVNGYRAGRTLWVIIPTVALVLTFAFTASWARSEHGLDWAPLLAAAVTLPVTLGASILWEYVYREELGA